MRTLEEEKLLEVKNLQVSYFGVQVIRDVSFNLYRGEVLGIVGESGSGKTTIAKAILRILGTGGFIHQGSSALYRGLNRGEIDILKIPLSEYNRSIRWKEISIVPQSALNSLNPTIKVKEHFIETGRTFELAPQQTLEKAKKLLEAVRLDPDRVLRMYSIELSGGMKQRVLIALALLLNPKIVILDEPTTALDVLTQRTVLDLLRKIHQEYKLTYILITHDIALVAELANRVIVMYAGKIVEVGGVEEIFYSPLHPYTRLLLATVPKLGDFEKLPIAIPGTSIDYRRLPLGCPFNPRCPYTSEICRRGEPQLADVGKGRYVACYMYTNLWRR